MKHRVLLLSNLDTELGDPFFRVGAYKSYLLPIAKALRQTGDFETKFFVSKHIYASLIKEGHFSSENDPIVLDVKQHKPLIRAIASSYVGFSELDRDTCSNQMDELLGDWEPDFIICWEAPTELLRGVFPKAVCIDLMPSIFSRPPYPKAISLDPVGLYKNSWFASPNPALASVTDEHLQTVKELRNVYLNHYETLACREKISELLKISTGSNISLVPLQISNYFGFRENCSFRDQFAFIEAVASSTNDVIVTSQYVGNLVSERVLSSKTLAYIKEHLGDVRYSPKFESVDSISQYIIPWVDTVYSVSSTLGLQAKLLGKRLISPASSHLQYFADSTSLNNDSTNINRDELLAAYLHRGIVLFDRIIQEKGYMSNILLNILSKKTRGFIGSELLPDAHIVDNSLSTFINGSNFKRSSENLGKIFPNSIKNLAPKVVPDDVAKSLASSGVSVVSFDVFDTLVRRAVYTPEDVFSLIQRKLKAAPKGLPDHAITRFSEMRVAAERLVRQKRDRAIESGINLGLQEEITINEVYTEFANILGLEDMDISGLIAIEETTELEVLKPRQVGKAMFDMAISSGKKVVITSDFIHSFDFVSRVLKQCGYISYDKLYLSSEIGMKKHSGRLFDYLIADIKIEPSQILHIGDNPVGDLKMARSKKLRALMVPAARPLFKEALHNRSLTEQALNKSFYLRTVAGLFANRYLSTNKPRRTHSEISTVPKEFEVISSREELGFLVVGPLAFAFSQWIVEKALSDSVDQVVFFARDCHLPFLMCKKIVEKRGLSNRLNLIYAPTSRKIVTGFDIHKPEDVLSVRIDDFTASGSLSKLLNERFVISPDLIDDDLLEKWNVPSASSEKKQLSVATIYGLTLDIARRHWDLLAPRYEIRRRNFVEYLQNTTPIDFGAKSAAVDFGYQGSIHRKISALFDTDLLPYFFMTYSDGFGNAPIENAQAFYASNRNASTRSNVCITHNLILETLMNEGVGSAVEVVKLSDGSLDIIRDETFTEEHAETVRDVHKGALTLCEQWLEECDDLVGYATIEKDSVAYFFSVLANSPTHTDVELLSHLVFDNGFAGVKSSKIIDNQAFWPQAFRLREKKAAPKPTNSRREIITNPVKQVKSATKPRSSLTSIVAKPVVRPFIKVIGNHPGDVAKFNKDPSTFFAKLKNPIYRRVGALLFPVS